MRHPHARNASPGAITAISAMTPDASSRPSGTPICGRGAERSATRLRGVLDGHQNRTAPLAAGRDALQDAQQDQQDRAPRSRSAS